MKTFTRKLSIVFLILSTLLFNLFFFACKSDSLKEHEKKVYNGVIYNLEKFKNPASVRVTSIIQKGNTVVSIKISGENSYGGMVSNEYLLFIEDFQSTKFSYVNYAEKTLVTESEVLNRVKSSDSWTTFMNQGALDLELCEGDNFPSYSVQKINAALDNYKKEKGWI